MTDTDPTPERRWTLERTGNFVLDGEPKFYSEVLAALNEAETLRAELHRKTTALTVAVAFAEEVRTERDAARERVRVLEALVTRVATMRKNDWIALSLEARVLAGAETQEENNG